MSVHTCKEPDQDVSEGEQLIFKDPICPEGEAGADELIDKEQLQFDMQVVSDNYISSMLLRIEQELKSNEEYKLIQDSSQRKNKKKKAKKQATPKDRPLEENKQLPEIVRDSHGFHTQGTTMEESSKDTIVLTSSKPVHLALKAKHGEKYESGPKEFHLGDIESTAAADRKHHPGKRAKKQKANANKQASDDERVFELAQGQPKLSEELFVQKKNMSYVVTPNQKFNRYSDLTYSRQTAQNSRMSSRQQSPVNTSNSVTLKSVKCIQGRRRNRKKNKAALDPEEVMNQFIIQLNSKKEAEKKSQKGKQSYSKTGSTIHSRKTSETRAPISIKPALPGDDLGSAKPKPSKQIATVGDKPVANDVT